MSLDIEQDEFFEWTTDEQEFKVCFPGFSDRVEEVKQVVEEHDSFKEPSTGQVSVS
ncbi:hypothetical protein QM012_005542 [Aureobasidium pullulans]|uniref:Uncharacterized protein n=1 Tax=Aureobasidium pullulans TaxID=5580 RepID=A0ABR0T4U4_AURPU